MIDALRRLFVVVFKALEVLVMASALLMVAAIIMAVVHTAKVVS